MIFSPKWKSKVEDTARIAVFAAVLFPFFTALGAWVSLMGEKTGFELYLFSSTAFLGLVGSIYFLPKVWRFNTTLLEAVVNEKSSQTLSGREASQVIKLVAFSILLGWFAAEFFLPENGLGLVWVIAGCFSGSYLVFSSAYKLFLQWTEADKSQYKF